MQAYVEHYARYNVIEIGDYIWSETSGIVQGEVIAILTTRLRSETHRAYLVERPDMHRFTIFEFDVRSFVKSDAWYEQLAILANQ